MLPSVYVYKGDQNDHDRKFYAMSGTQRVVVLAALIVGSLCEDLDQRQFPSDFQWGVATAAYQVEGGWNARGKGESIWDRWTHEHPERILNGSNGDVACDSYDKYREDVQLVKNLGVDYYRFSLSWTRIVPTGRLIDGINLDGLRYYNALINELILNNIKPVVTLYHWDLPAYLQDTYGGWPNGKIADYFVDFANLAFLNFGDRVKTWITINEPKQVCKFGYGDGLLAPALTKGGVLDYQCAKTVLLAHARAYKLYQDRYCFLQRGKIGFTMDSFWFEPGSDKQEDIDAAERIFQFYVGIFANPIYGSGDWPAVVKEFIATRSAAQGLATSRLPSFSASEVKLIKGSADFFGLNFYTAIKILDAAWKPLNESNWDNDARVTYYWDPAWPGGSSYWLKVVPYSMRKVLNLLKTHYGDMPIIITENGYSDLGEMIDTARANYILTYLNNALAAILDDNVNLVGYTAWSLMDNFEWVHGYVNRFGIYSVNFTDPVRPRSEKLSTIVYKSIVTNDRLLATTINP